MPDNVVLPPTLKSVPTNNFLATAAPPATVNEPPLLLLVASTVLLKLTVLDAVKVPVLKPDIPVISSFKLDNTNLLKPLAMLTIG